MIPPLVLLSNTHAPLFSLANPPKHTDTHTHTPRQTCLTSELTVQHLQAPLVPAPQRKEREVGALTNRVHITDSRDEMFTLGLSLCTHTHRPFINLSLACAHKGLFLCRNDQDKAVVLVRKCSEGEK